MEEKDEFWSQTFEEQDFSGQEIGSKEFDSCVFKKCDFSGAIFKRCNFVDCEFINCNFSLMKIEYSKFSEVSFRESKLVGIDWTKVAWPGLVLDAPIKFYQSIVNDCSFYGLSLQELILDECKAHNSDFREADLSNASFNYTDFAGSSFDSTNLTGADFSEATDYDINIYRNNVKKAKFSRFEAVRLLDYLEIELVE